MRLGKKPYRITVFRQLGGVGDILMLTPVFRGLREKYGKDCKITVATSPFYLSGVIPMLLRGNPFIDDIVRVDPYQFAPWSLKAGKPEYRGVPNDQPPNCVLDTDLIIDLNCVCSMTESAQQPHVKDHRTDIWCKAAHVNPSCKKPILVLTNDEREFGHRWCQERLGEGTRIGVVLQTQAQARNWPYTPEFAEILLERGYKVCTIDGVRRVSDRIPAAIGMDIRRVAAILENLDAVVSPDTGILHLAGTVGTPVLGLFGSTDGALRMREYPGSWSDTRKVVDCGPCCYAYACLKSDDTRDHFQCLKRLTTSFVLYEMERMLDRFGVTVP